MNIPVTPTCFLRSLCSPLLPWEPPSIWSLMKQFLPSPPTLSYFCACAASFLHCSQGTTLRPVSVLSFPFEEAFFGRLPLTLLLFSTKFSVLRLCHRNALCIPLNGLFTLEYQCYCTHHSLHSCSELFDGLEYIVLIFTFPTHGTSRTWWPHGDGDMRIWEYEIRRDERKGGEIYSKNNKIKSKFKKFF